MAFPEKIAALITRLKANPRGQDVRYEFMIESHQIEFLRGSISGPPSRDVDEQIYCNRYLSTFYEAQGIRLGAGDGSYYLRFAPDEQEFVHAQQGNLRCSTNHLTKLPEKGVSVSRTLGYYAQRNEFVYVVRGLEIATGSDAEPILEATSITPVTPSHRTHKYLRKFYELNGDVIRRQATRNQMDEMDVFRVLIGLIHFDA